MAEFKKTPGSDIDGPFDSVDTELFWQIATAYWPAILGGVTLFLLIALGKEKIAIPVGIIVVLLQGYLLFG